MSPEQIERLIGRYVAGEATPEEAEHLEARMAADAALAEQVDALRRAWQAAGATRSPWDSSAAWKAVKPRLVPQSAEPADRAPLTVVRGRGGEAGTGRLRAHGWRLARVAAVLLLVAGGGWGLTEWASRAADPPALAQVVTERAQVSDVYLSDGTRVMLGVETTLRFAPGLGRGTRDVYLDGNAFFDVSRDPSRPFRVHTAQGVTEVLGTSFGVRAYDTDSATTVVVAEGRVRLVQSVPAGEGADRAPERTAGASSSVVLEPGDLGRVGARGEIEKQRGVAVDRHLAWRERRLVFTDAPLREVAVEIARWYDIEVAILDPALEPRRLSATFGVEPLDQVLQHLEIALGVRVEREAQTVTFRSQ